MNGKQCNWEFRNREENSYITVYKNCNGVVIWNSMLFNQTKENAKENPEKFMQQNVTHI